MTRWESIFWWALVTVGLTQVVTKSLLLSAFREGVYNTYLRIAGVLTGEAKGQYTTRTSGIAWFWSRLVYCPMCFGAWAGAFCGLFFGVYPVLWFTTFCPLLDLVLALACSGFAGSFLAFLLVELSDLVYRAATKFESEEDGD